MKEKNHRRNEEFEEDIYTNEGIDEALESDEISDEEYGFMHGYNQDEE